MRRFVMHWHRFVCRGVSAASAPSCQGELGSLGGLQGVVQTPTGGHFARLHLPTPGGTNGTALPLPQEPLQPLLVPGAGDGGAGLSSQHLAGRGGRVPPC